VNAPLLPPQEAYQRFLEAKVPPAQSDGIDIDPAQLSPWLRPHCRIIVPWAVRGGRRAIFTKFGLHKTAMQLDAVRLCIENCPVSGTKTVGGDAAGLIVLPLGVRAEFIREAAADRMNIDLKFIRRESEIEPGKLHLTNYEPVRDGKINPALFTATSLDEAAVLRDFGSKTYQEFLPLFAPVRYRFVATALPSPNRYKELIHYAAYLGIMDSGQALTRWFQRDSEQAGNLTLYPHKEEEFWHWVHSWAVFLNKPSDLGCSDEGYVLPELDVHWHEVATDHSSAGADRDGQALMFKDTALGVVQAASERRDTTAVRVAKMKELVAADPEDHFILWHDTEAEREAIGRAIPKAVAVYGAMDIDDRERITRRFADGELQHLATKKILNGAGSNFQRHCHRAVYAGIDDKFHDFFQSIFRILRFGQTEACRIDIIHTEAQQEQVRRLKKKWGEYEAMQVRMSEMIRQYGLNHIEMTTVLRRSIGIERRESAGESFAIANNDCVLEARGMPANSVKLMVTSIPFANHYEYSPSYNDFGHTTDNAEFWGQMDFLSPELLRILEPGRLACIHVKDRILFGAVTGAGAPTVSPFHAEAIMHYRRHGFDYMGMITVNTDVVRENNQTYRLGWSENAKDSTKMGVGSPEYILLLRKPQSDRSKGYADVRVTKAKPLCERDDGTPTEAFDEKLMPIPGTGYSRSRWQIDAHAFWRSSGDRMLSAEEMASYGPAKLAKVYTSFSLAHVYDHEHHVQIGEELDAKGALPATFMSLAPGGHDGWTWHDVVRMRTLNSEQSQRRRENHLCPLQLDIVDRLIRRFSNPGDLVFDPFMGIGTVPSRAIRQGRRGGGSELSAEYFADAVHYCTQAEKEAAVPTFFDFEKAEDEEGEAA
jgi:DNA modification methylase